MKTIEAQTMLEIGDRSVMQTTEDGIVTTGDGKPKPYEKGSILLADKDGAIITPILSMEGANRLAAAVVSGDARAITANDTCIALAAAVLALTTTVQGGG